MQRFERDFCYMSVKQRKSALTYVHLFAMHKKANCQTLQSVPLSHCLLILFLSVSHMACQACTLTNLMTFPAVQIKAPCSIKLQHADFTWSTFILIILLCCLKKILTSFVQFQKYPRTDLCVKLMFDLWGEILLDELQQNELSSKERSICNNCGGVFICY